MPINLNALRMNYTGACALLARLSSRPGLSEDDKECIERALNDCVAMFPRDLEVWKLGGGAFSLEVRRS